MKIGAKVVSHGRYVTFQLAELAVPRELFRNIWATGLPNEGRPPKSGHRMAAEGMPFSWRWNGGTISPNLDGIRGMLVKCPFQNEGSLDGSSRKEQIFPSGSMKSPTVPHVSLEVTWNRSGDYPFGHKDYVIGISARTVIERSQFAMTYVVEEGWVGDQVDILIELEARRD